MKKYLYTIVGGLIISLILYGYSTYKELKHYKELYAISDNNVKAYEATNSKLNKDIREFKFTMDELRSSNDSLNQKLVEAVDKLKVKDKSIKYLQYQASIAHKTDTITIKGDTIFKDTFVALDTTIRDNWYSMDLSLRYPSTIITTPTFKSEKYVVIHTKKEYNSKPSKIFFVRWFQKKHTVVTVEVKEDNPYIDNREQKFIEIVK
mgnify:CR=1 FL=1